jgi:hypothetical protein
MDATPIDELRKPHPDQMRIDAEAARLLLISAAGYLGPRPKGVRKPDRGQTLAADALILRRR